MVENAKKFRKKWLDMPGGVPFSGDDGYNGSTTMKKSRNLAVVLGLAVYAVAFYAVSLPSVCNDAGRPLLRIELLGQLLLLPEKWLTPNWFGTPPEFSVLDRLPVLLGAAVILAWAMALGWLLLRLCRADRGWQKAEIAVFATAVGLSVLSTWTLLLGLFGIMERLAVFVVPAVLTLATCFWVWRRGKSPNHLDSTRSEVPCHPEQCEESGNKQKPLCCAQNDGLHSSLELNLCWLWLGLPFVAVIFLAAMLPPLDFDVREYHLQAPKEFFQQGQITFLPHNVYANMALGTEMLSLLAMILTGDWQLGALVGKTVIAAFTPLCAWALFLAGRRMFSPTAGVVAALVFVSTPWVVSIASGGFVEGASACYLFLAIYALLRGNEKNTSNILLAGYLAGSAVATKYPAALFVLLPLAVWLVFRERSAKRLGVFLLAAAVGCGLWFGKNAIQTGNPTYPLLYDVFGGRTWTFEKEQQWNQVHRPHDFSAATFSQDLGRVILTSEWLSPLVIPLAFLAFIGQGTRGTRWPLLAYAGFVMAVWWLFTHRIDRFWIPVLPVLALLAGAGACWTSDRWWRVFLSLLLVLGLGANFLVASAGQGNAWFVRLAHLRQAPAWIDPWHLYFNKEMSKDEALLTVGDAAVFDLKPRVYYNTCFDDCLFEQWIRDKSLAEIRATLKSRHIAYVYVHWGEIERYRATYGFTEFVQPSVFDRLVAQGLLEPLPAIEGHSARAYRVR